MRYARPFTTLLVLVLVATFMVACAAKRAKTTAASRQRQSGTIIPAGPLACTVQPDKLQVSRGGNAYWLLTHGAKGKFEVTFDKGDGSPCDGSGPWIASENGPSQFCTISANAAYKLYRYKITRKDDGTVCADPSVQVCNGGC